MSDPRQIEEKWQAYIAQKRELQSEESLNAYYVMFDGTGDAEEQQMISFWKQTVYEYAYSVNNQFGVRLDEMVKRFTLHDRIPCGLPLVMRELAKQGSLASREEILNGALYGREKDGKGAGGGKRALVGRVATAVASGLYRNTFGYFFGGGSDNQESVETQGEQDLDKEYICVDYLERQCDIFVRWAFKNELTLMSLAKAKQNLQKSTSHSLGDIELLLKHLEYSGRILVEKMTCSTSGDASSDESILIKFLQPSERESGSGEISKKEIAMFQLQKTIDKIEAKSQDCDQKATREAAVIKQLLQQKNRQGAMTALQRKKMYQEEGNRQRNLLTNLEQQKFTLEAAEENSVIFETLSLATATSKEFLQQNGGSEQTSFCAEEMRNEMAQQMEDRAKLDNLFAEGAANVGDLDEADLLKELDNLSIEENQREQYRIKAERQQQEAEALNLRLADWERQNGANCAIPASQEAATYSYAEEESKEPVQLLER